MKSDVHICGHFGVVVVVVAGVGAVVVAAGDGAVVVAAGTGDPAGCDGAGVAGTVGAAVVGSGSDVAGVAGALAPSSHSPSVTIMIFAAGLRHCATDSSQAFEYVLPLEPHTGLYMAVHTIGHSEPAEDPVDGGVVAATVGVSIAGDPAAVGVGRTTTGVAGEMYDVRSSSNVCGCGSAARWENV